MSNPERYEIQQVRLPSGEPAWTVIAYRGETCLGGDKHWLRQEFAEAAKRSYEDGSANHGDLTTTATVLGEGRLTWPRMERVTDRYGSVFLMPDGDSMTPPSGTTKLNNVADLFGQRGRLVAEVLETRQSTHIGDFFRGVYPETPNVGDRIELGEGTLFSDRTREGDTTVGLEPDDGRTSDWLDPRQLYRAHEQTVRLVFEPTR
jgi:hypothetical protein